MVLLELLNVVGVHARLLDGRWELKVLHYKLLEPPGQGAWAQLTARNSVHPTGEWPNALEWDSALEWLLE